MENADIKRYVHEITSSVAQLHGNANAIRRLRTNSAATYRAFAAKYPKLFDMCWDPSFDHAQFEFLMSRLEDINARRATFEESTQRVADVLNERYVIPLVGQATRSNGESNMDNIHFTCSGAGMSVKTLT